LTRRQILAAKDFKNFIVQTTPGVIASVFLCLWVWGKFKKNEDAMGTVLHHFEKRKWLLAQAMTKSV